jgi:hypothetical protein
MSRIGVDSAGGVCRTAATDCPVGRRPAHPADEIAGGRIDVRFAFGTDRIVTEVKRDQDPFAEEALAKYLNQAGAYQASNVRLGLLLVLDLSDKSKGQGRSLEKNVWLTTKPSLAPEDLERHIVVIVVPGNRTKTPSQLKS